MVYVFILSYPVVCAALYYASEKVIKCINKSSKTNL